MTFPSSFRISDATRRSQMMPSFIQMAIDNHAASPASAANEYTKPQLSTHIIDLFQNYAWAATGELVSDGITPFNLTFVSETGTWAMAT